MFRNEKNLKPEQTAEFKAGVEGAGGGKGGEHLHIQK